MLALADPAALLVNDKLRKELDDFRDLWHGGFRTGYGDKRNQGRIEAYLHETVPPGTCMLEIGCGGGQWSRSLARRCALQKLYCVDALPEAHNGFWNYVGAEHRGLIEYHQVFDFSLGCIPDDSLDYVFSYDVFCHISLSGQEQYLKNLRRKCRDGARLLIMYADPAKYLGSEPENLWFVRSHLPASQREGCSTVAEVIDAALADCDGASSPGRWYWIGVDRFVGMAEQYGYVVESRDMDIDLTNPLTLLAVDRTAQPA
jgi:SAM-dependent methyltransferase